MVEAYAYPACKPIICAASVNASSTIATETPIAIPRTASATAHSARVPIVTIEALTTGQRANSAKVSADSSAARTGSGTPLIPGRGTKLKAPATRASTRRKA